MFPSPARPPHLNKEGPDHGVYVRVGSTNRRADRALVEELRRYAHGEAYDEQPMPDLDSEVMDFRAASELFESVRKLRRSDLESLRLVTRYQGRSVPTVGGIIVFCRERERYFPDTWIQAGRFQGRNKARILDQAEMRSLPVRAIEEAIAFVHRHTLQGPEIGSVRRRERWSLPPLAVPSSTR